MEGIKTKLCDQIYKAETMMQLAEVEMKLEQQKIDDALQRYALYKGRYATVKSYRDSLQSDLNVLIELRNITLTSPDK